MPFASGRRFLFDVTGLLHWYAYFSHPSGIPRVAEKLISRLWRRHGEKVEFVARMLGNDNFHRIDGQVLANLDEPGKRRAAIARLRAIFTYGMRQAPLRSLLADLRYYHIPYLYLGTLRMERLVGWFFGGSCFDKRTPPPTVSAPGPRDVFFNPGDPWWERKQVTCLLDIRARTKVQLVLMIHDLFVIERPDWFEPRFAELFGAEFKRLAPSVDRWVTNSNFVTNQLRRHLAERSLEQKPMEALPMGWDSFPLHHGKSIHDKRVLSRFGLAERPFILFVGTVEPRKNLPLLLDAMDELRQRADLNMPDLVVVGGRGWRSQDVRTRLKRDPKVHWLRGVNDRDLAALYKHARFTVAPSIIEGWGLPVQESLAHGVPCIASNAGAHPESGLDLATYFESGSRTALSQALANWIENDKLLEERKLAIKKALQSARLPNWDDAAEGLLRHAFADASS